MHSNQQTANDEFGLSGPAQPAVTIAICTWNRCQLLDQTLASMKALNSSSMQLVELVVIDNGSTDTTSDVAAKHKNDLPLRYVFEPKQGLANARNRALDEAVSEWVIFTDDDVLFESGWLEAYLQSIHEIPESVAFLGGEVRPWFVTPPDPALAEAIPIVEKGFCGVEIPEDIEINLQSTQTPFGANFAIRRSAAPDLRFNAELGVRGLLRLESEETEFMRRLLNLGYTGRWVPSARLRHYVPPERLQLSYLRRHLFGNGRSQVIRDGIPAGKRIGSVPLWVMREIAESGVGMIFFAKLNSKMFYKSFSRFFSRTGIMYQCIIGKRTKKAAQ